jgi:hypothetical protein
MASKKEIKINVDEPEDTKPDSGPEAAADSVDSADPSGAVETKEQVDEVETEAEPLSEEDQLRLRVAEL